MKFRYLFCALAFVLWVGNSTAQSQNHQVIYESPEYEKEWIKDIEVGSHSITAIMQDSLGNEMESESVNISVKEKILNLYTPFDNGIIVPERKTFTLYIFKGGTSSTERDWNNTENILWKMPLKNANGIAESEMNTYNNLWQGRTSINDVKRVIHNKAIHLVVTGNGGDAVAMYEFETKKCIFWSNTNGTGPHDVEYAPVGKGYILVANPDKKLAVLEVYDLSSNNKGCAFSLPYKGIHSVHWDAKQQLVWAWGRGLSGLKSYKLIVENGKPKLTDTKVYEIPIENFTVGSAHGGSPMLKDGKRYLILAGNSGILQFDTEAHEWSVVRWAEKDKDGKPTGLFKGCKGLSYNDFTHEIIIGKSNDKIYSETDSIGVRQIDNSEIYKARWWLHNSFSYEEE